jgi:glycosyltransferase involved in cell wall biosynthesis
MDAGKRPLLDVPTAIVHDWFQGFHGSERTVDAMRRSLFAPGNEPDVYTFSAARELLPPELAERIVGESRLSRLPGIRQQGHDPGHWRLLLPYMPFYFEHLELDRYDVVISSAHAFADRVRTRPDALHVSYCYTPPRYVWLHDTDSRLGLAAKPLRALLQRLDLDASTRPDGYAAISRAVADRIRTIYGRTAEVIPPPVDVDAFDPSGEDRDGFVWIGRLVSYKRPDLIIEAFRDLPYSLTLVGIGPLERRLRENLPDNVRIVGWLERPELVRLLERAQGFVHLAEEDFGIALVEALAAGTPVLALARGGALDIVRPDLDGILVEDETDLAAVRKGVRRLAAETWDRQSLAARAAEFSADRFADRFGRYIAELDQARARA